jgi:uncharacterized repeat protein (TIGR04138 family)
MRDPSHPVEKLMREDRRYKLEAYAFVFEALNYAHEVLGLGAETTSEEEPAEKRGREKEKEKEKEKHLSGQQLCEAIRVYALEQYGYMAKTVLNSWGVHNTGDFGEIVFNLIRIKQMKKTREDRREDFNDVFDFDTGLTRSFKITPPK